MKVPANASADKLILDYLARVTEAGLRYLPKGARIAFVGQTKAVIERECGPAGRADPDRVREVLAGLGEPEDLVRRERARIDAAWVKRRAGGQAAATPVIAPREPRSIRSRWKPATDTQPLSRAVGPHIGEGSPPQPPPAGQGPRAASPHAAQGPVPAQGASPERMEQGAEQTERDSPEQPPPGSYPERPVSYPVPPRGYLDWRRRPPDQPGVPPEGGRPADAPRSDRRAGDGPGEADGGKDGPQGAGGQDVGAAAGSGRSGRRFLPDVSAADVAALASAGARTARRQPVESLAVVLLAAGVIFPFPFWLLGGLVAAGSRFFDARDKWIALGGPLLLALVGTVVTAVIVGGHDNPVVIYLDALRLDIGYLLRVGSLLCAGYLVRRLRQGRRLRVPPWRR